MLTALAFYAASLTAPPPPAPHAVEWPGLHQPVPEWAFIVRAEPAVVRPDSPIPWAYSVGVDPAEPVESCEVDADVYVGEE